MSFGGISFASYKTAAGGGTDLSNWVAAVVANGGATPSATSQGFVGTLINSIKADSTLCPSGNLNDTIDQMWLLANFDTTGSSQTTDAQALTSLVNPTAATALAAPHGAWTSNTLGWQSNGSSGYIDTRYIPSSFSGAKNTQNSSMFGVYGLTTRAAADTKIAMGGFDATRNDQLLLKAASTQVNSVNDGTGQCDSTGFTQGLSLMIRSASGSAHNIVTTSGGPATTTSASTSNGLPTVPLFVCARNNNSTPDSFETIKIALAVVGGRSGTDAAYAAALFTPVQAYMTSLGIQI